MKHTIVPTCTFCDKELCLESGIDAFFHVSQEFEALAIDRNTGMLEPMHTLLRRSEAFICPDCWDIYVEHMDELLKKFPKELQNISQPFVTTKGNLTENAKLSKITKPYKAKEGSQFADTLRKTPPKNDQDKPTEVV